MIYQIILRQLALSPNKLALITSNDESFTYAQLIQRIHQWTHYLCSLNIKGGEHVGVLVSNEDYHPFIYAALDRINAIYVPFDIDIPPQQLQIDLETLGLKKMIIEECLLKQFPINEPLCSSLSEETLNLVFNSSITPLELPYETNELKKISYIVSSSGSTRQKKWIPTGAGLLYWANLEEKRGRDYPAEKFLSTRSPAYDARIYEYVAAFSSASILYLMPYWQRKDRNSILNVCKEKGINKIILIASQLSVGNTAALISQLKQ